MALAQLFVKLARRARGGLDRLFAAAGLLAQQREVLDADAAGREIDIGLPKPFPVTPQIRGAIKAMQGVVMIEDM